MHPAFSIILFTTLSGLGYGLAAMLGLGLLDPQAIPTKIAHLLALALIAGGLLSSTLHLGNPQRAWRALSQWRTSWLSREGVLAILTFVPLTVNAFLCIFYGRQLLFVGLAGSLLCVATVYCTAMIYASLRSVQAWNTKLTPACYLLLSLTGGLTMATFFAALQGGASVVPFAFATIAALAAAWVTKFTWWQRLDSLTPLSTAESATGLGFIGRVALFERPHVNENYLTREMGYRVARKHARKLRVIAFGLGAVLAGLLLVAAAGLAQGWLVAVAAFFAALAFFGGTLVERWLFFAESRHAVTAYYGR